MTTTVAVLGAFALLSFMESLLHTVKGFFLKFLVIGLLALPGFYAYKQAGAKLPDLSALSSMTGGMGVAKAQAQTQPQANQPEPGRNATLAQSGPGVPNPFGPVNGPKVATEGFKPVEAAPQQAPVTNGPRNVYLEKYGDPRLRPGAQGRITDAPGNRDQGAYEREQARRIQEGYGQNPQRRPQAGAYEDGYQPEQQRRVEHSYGANPRAPQGAYEGEDAYERAARERRGYRYQQQEQYAPRPRQGYGQPAYEEDLEEGYAPPPRYAPRPRPYGYEEGPRYQRQGYEQQGYGPQGQPEPSVVQGLRRWVGNAAGLN